MIYKHIWKKIKETYAPPIIGKTRIKCSSSKTFERAISGVTTIIWECSICGELRKEEMLGKDIEIKKDGG